MTTNKNRANRAAAALLAHQVKDCNGSELQALTEVSSDPEAVLRYLLADLRHWCDAKGIAFHEADRKAHALYTEELEEARRRGTVQGR